MHKHISLISALLFYLMLLTACSQKDIVYDNGVPREISVRFMWDNAPAADVDGMTLYFFPVSEGTRLWRFDISGREGGKIELPDGTYSMIAVNNDLPGVRFPSPESYNTFFASARITADNGDIAPTGMLYGAAIDQVTVTPCGVSYITPQGTVKDCSKSLVRCYPDSLSTQYCIILRDVENSEKVRSVKSRLSGVATSLLIASAQSTGLPGASQFTLNRSGNSSNTFTGKTTAFGTPPGNPSFLLYVNATMQDGKVYTKSFDVTEQVINSPWKRNVLIILEGVSFPEGEPPDKPDDPDVGIDVGVDGWEQIDIDYDTSDPGSYRQ